MATRKKTLAHPEEARTEAVRLYEVDGLMPGAIQRSLVKQYGEIPLDTIKNWLRGKQRGVGLDEPYAKWDFLTATPAERHAIAPLFAAEHLRAIPDEEGHEHIADPEDIWPSQQVGDWFIRFRQLVPDKPVGEVYRDARHVALLERRIGADPTDGEATMTLRSYMAHYLEEAGKRQSAAPEDPNSLKRPFNVTEVTDPQTGEVSWVFTSIETPR
jgi:hypothetical protein